MASINPLLLAAVRFGATYYTLRSTQGSAADLRFPASGDLARDTDYFASGDGTATDLLTMLDTCLTAHASTYSFNVTLNSSLNVEVETVSHGDLFTLEWAHVNTTLNPAIFGFAVANTASAFRATATGRPTSMWRPERPPNEDGRERQDVIANVAETMDGDQRTAVLAAPKKTRDVTFLRLPQEKVLTEYAAGGDNFESIFTSSLVYGYVFHYYADETARSSSDYGAYRMRAIRPADAYQRDESSPAKTRWKVTIPMRRTT